MDGVFKEGKRGELIEVANTLVTARRKAKRQAKRILQAMEGRREGVPGELNISGCENVLQGDHPEGTNGNVESVHKMEVYAYQSER